MIIYLLLTFSLLLIKPHTLSTRSLSLSHWYFILFLSKMKKKKTIYYLIIICGNIYILSKYSVLWQRPLKDGGTCLLSHQTETNGPRLKCTDDPTVQISSLRFLSPNSLSPLHLCPAWSGPPYIWQRPTLYFLSLYSLSLSHSLISLCIFKPQKIKNLFFTCGGSQSESDRPQKRAFTSFNTLPFTSCFCFAATCYCYNPFFHFIHIFLLYYIYLHFFLSLLLFLSWRSWTTCHHPLWCCCCCWSLVSPQFPLMGHDVPWLCLIECFVARTNIDNSPFCSAGLSWFSSGWGWWF